MVGKEAAARVEEAKEAVAMAVAMVAVAMGVVVRAAVETVVVRVAVAMAAVARVEEAKEAAAMAAAAMGVVARVAAARVVVGPVEETVGLEGQLEVDQREGTIGRRRCSCHRPWHKRRKCTIQRTRRRHYQQSKRQEWRLGPVLLASRCRWR